MRFALAIVIAISIAWGSVAGAVTRTNAHSMAAGMSDCAEKVKTGCPCKHAPANCAEANCSLVCAQMVGLIDFAADTDFRTTAPTANFSPSAFSAMAPEFEPPIPRS